MSHLFICLAGLFPLEGSPKEPALSCHPELVKELWKEQALLHLKNGG
jgi:hypothetical protein